MYTRQSKLQRRLDVYGLFARQFQFWFGHEPDRVISLALFIACLYMVQYMRVTTLVNPSVLRLPVGHYTSLVLVDRFRTMYFTSLDWLLCILNHFRTILTHVGPPTRFQGLPGHFRVKAQNFRVLSQLRPYLV